jgi:hypothetical protein
VACPQVRYTTYGRAHHPEAPMLGDTALAAAAAATYVHAARAWPKAELNAQFLTGARPALLLLSFLLMIIIASSDWHCIVHPFCSAFVQHLTPQRPKHSANMRCAAIACSRPPSVCAGFHCFAEGQGRLILGVNFRRPLLTGFNSREYERLWHRGASCPPYPAPCARAAALSQAPDQNALPGALLWLPGFRDSAPDVRGAGGENGTVVSLENNAAAPLLFAALAARAESASYMACLQGQGALLPHPVCRHERPLPTRLGPAHVPVLHSQPRFKGLWSIDDSRAVVAPPPPPPTPSNAFAGANGTAGYAGNSAALGDAAATADQTAYGK